MAKFIRLVNLTPHVIRIALSDDSFVSFEASGQVARVSSKEVGAGELSVNAEGLFSRFPLVEIPLSKVEYGAVEGLPYPEEGVGYIVSGVVAALAPERDDVFAPNTSSTAIRKDGQVFAVRSLIPAKK